MSRGRGGAEQVPCAICGEPVDHDPRYPRQVCRVCRRRATDAAGRKVGFGNLSMSGGFWGYYADVEDPEKHPYNEHECFIDSIRCWADEAHMGGIVVERAD